MLWSCHNGGLKDAKTHRKYIRMSFVKLYSRIRLKAKASNFGLNSPQELITHDL